jgi:hypothetical protein
VDTPIEEEEEEPEEEPAALLTSSLATVTGLSETSNAPSYTPIDEKEPEEEAAALPTSPLETVTGSNEAAALVPASLLVAATAAAEDFLENEIRARRKANGGANTGRKIQRTRKHSSKAKRTSPNKTDSLQHLSPTAKNSMPVEESSPLLSKQQQQQQTKR